jgi:hypothetical protein
MKNNLEEARGKSNFPSYREGKIRIVSGLTSETMQARREGGVEYLKG